MTEIVIVHGKNKKEVYRVTGRTLAKVIRIVRDEDTVPVEAVFPELYDDRTRLGTAIRGFRYRDQLTQVELAEKLGVTQSNLSSMETGKRPIGKDMARRLAKAFKTDYRVFL